jgi:hypothetical protein
MTVCEKHGDMGKYIVAMSFRHFMSYSEIGVDGSLCDWGFARKE